MKKAIYIFLAFAAVIILYYLYGIYSFNNYVNRAVRSNNMNIPVNENAPVKSMSQLEIAAPVDTVWKILTGIRNWPEWQKSVTETTAPETVEEGTEFHWKAGGLSFKSRIHTAELHKAFGWTGTTLGAAAVHNWRFIEKENSTVVIVEESLQGIFPGIFKGYFQKNLDKGVLTNLEELKEASLIRSR